MKWIAGVAEALGGCATLVEGVTQSVVVDVVPAQMATAPMTLGQEAKPSPRAQPVTRYRWPIERP